MATTDQTPAETITEAADHLKAARDYIEHRHMRGAKVPDTVGELTTIRFYEAVDRIEPLLRAMAVDLHEGPA